MVRAFDMKMSGREVALKISRNKSFDINNTKFEIKILEKLKVKDP